MEEGQVDGESQQLWLPADPTTGPHRDSFGQVLIGWYDGHPVIRQNADGTVEYGRYEYDEEGEILVHGQWAAETQQPPAQEQTIPDSQAPEEVRTPVGAPKDTKKKRQRSTDWGVEETMALIKSYAPKLIEQKEAAGRGQKVFTKAKALWQAVAQNLTDQGYPRSHEQCATKWGSLYGGYKQIRDWSVKSGRRSYWHMLAAAAELETISEELWDNHKVLKEDQDYLQEQVKLKALPKSFNRDMWDKIHEFLADRPNSKGGEANDSQNRRKAARERREQFAARREEASDSPETGMEDVDTESGNEDPEPQSTGKKKRKTKALLTAEVMSRTGEQLVTAMNKAAEVSAKSDSDVADKLCASFEKVGSMLARALGAPDA